MLILKTLISRFRCVYLVGSKFQPVNILLSNFELYKVKKGIYLRGSILHLPFRYYYENLRDA